MKNKCIISFIKRVECNYSQETHEKIEKGKQINKRCTSFGTALGAWECSSRDLNTHPLLATCPWIEPVLAVQVMLFLRTFCTPVHVSEKIKSAHVTHFSVSDWLHPWTRFIICYNMHFPQTQTWFYSELVFNKLMYGCEKTWLNSLTSADKCSLLHNKWT